MKRVYKDKFPDMPCMKRVQEGIGPLVSSQEERALLVPVINRGSTPDFVPAFGLNRVSLVRAYGAVFRRRVFVALEGARDPCLLGDQFCWHPVLPDPAPPSAGRPDPHRLWYVRVLDSSRYSGQQPGTKSARGPADKPLVNRGFCSPIGLNRISLVRACKGAFRTVVHDTLEG